MILLVLILLLSLSLSLEQCNNYTDHDSYLPVLPRYIPPEFNLSLVETRTYNYSLPSNTSIVNNNTIIPRNLWISFKVKPSNLEELDVELLDVIKRAREDGWNVYLLGHEEQINFFNVYYPNTSVTWAVNIINSGVSVSDIWRVAATYLFGGFYMDDDADIRKSLNEIISNNDSMIVSHELQFKKYSHKCYQSDFKLSQKALMNKYDSTTEVRQITQYMFFAKRGHSLLLRILTNVVEAIKLEYFNKHPFFFNPADPKWKYVICATGPELWSASYIESVLENRTNEDSVTIENFPKYYQTTFKVPEAKHYIKRTAHHQHYYNMNSSTFLNSYHPILCVESLIGKVLRLHNVMYLVTSNHTLRLIPNYDTFCAMNYTLHDLVVYQHFPSALTKLPVGLDLPPLDWDTVC